jgi:hypothetical protein
MPISPKRKRGRQLVDRRDQMRYVVAKLFEEQIAERDAGLGRPLPRPPKGYFRAAVVAVLAGEGITDPRTVHSIWKRLARQATR